MGLKYGDGRRGKVSEEDYVGLCKMDFRYRFLHAKVWIMREFAIDKLRLERGIRAIRYERRIKKTDEASILKCCWKKKEKIQVGRFIEKEKAFVIGMDRVSELWNYLIGIVTRV